MKNPSAIPALQDDVLKNVSKGQMEVVSMSVENVLNKKLFIYYLFVNTARFELSI